MQPFSCQWPVHTAATGLSHSEWHPGCQDRNTQDSNMSSWASQILFFFVALTEVTVMNCLQQNLMWMMKIEVPHVVSGYPQSWSQGYLRDKHLSVAAFFSRAQSAPTESKAAFLFHFKWKKKIQSTVSTISQSYQRALMQTSRSLIITLMYRKDLLYGKGLNMTP